MSNRGLLNTLVAVGLVYLSAAAAAAAEPNETFETATVLAPNVRSVMDELTPGVVGSAADTLLGIRDMFGEIVFVDDDGSPLGDGRASGVGGVPTNSGSIDFAVSGYPDDGFFGDHGESGGYQVYVDVYDFFDDLVDSFSELHLLEPGEVEEFTYTNFEWIGGSYDVYIDNQIPSGGDVDFFRFTGLTPGAAFSAETIAPSASILDTTLGQFDGAGNLIAEDEDAGEGNLSLLTGVVPEAGALTFAVTGFGDSGNYNGFHFQNGDYELRLTVDVGLTADFDNDNDVDGADFLEWRRAFAQGASADADGDSDSDGADFLAWQREFGSPAAVGQAAAVPEPSAAILLALAFFGTRLSRTHRDMD